MPCRVRAAIAGDFEEGEQSAEEECKLVTIAAIEAFNSKELLL